MKQKKNNKDPKPLKTLSWGEKIFLEIPIYKYRNQMIARYGENADGRKYIDISKFGPLPQGANGKSQTSKGTYSQRLRIYKPNHWGVIKNIVEKDLFPAIGWTKESAQKNVELSTIRGLTKQIQSKSSELEHKSQIIEELMDNIAIYRDQNIKNKVPEYKKKIEEFEKLIEAKKTENYYQQFLKQNYWMFGLEYISAKSQKIAGASNRPDFSLERYDKFRDIVEIKKPQDDIFVTKGARFHQSSKLKEALSEVMDYVDYFLSHVNDEMVEYEEIYYKPRAIIVIGRRMTLDKRIRQLNSYLHRIEIITYDDLLDRAKKIVEFYEK